MSIKTLVVQLEKHINNRFPKFKAKFYSNHHNFYIHLELDESLFGFCEYRELLQEIDNFLNIYLVNLFSFFCQG